MQDILLNDCNQRLLDFCIDANMQIQNVWTKGYLKG